MMTLLLDLFPEGLPCRSSLVPDAVKAVLKDHWSLHMIGLCSEPCVRGKGMVVVTDASGLVEEVVDNSRGIFSLRQKILELPKRVLRRTVARVRGSQVLLSCSRHRFGSKFYQWRNGSVLLNPMAVSQLSGGRVRIDLANNLHIMRAEFWDTGIYSCYDGTSLVATVKLKITGPSIIAKLHTFASYFNVAVLSGVILLVMFSVIRGSSL
ncbi:uncharacterized protein LOC144163168 isoform X2 [Haemaphysalis longicornis]